MYATKNKNSCNLNSRKFVKHILPGNDKNKRLISSMDLIQELKIIYDPIFNNKSDGQITDLFKNISRETQKLLELNNLNSKVPKSRYLMSKIKFGKYFSKQYLKKALERAKITKKYTLFNTILYGYFIFHSSPDKRKKLELQYAIAEELGFNSLAEMFEEIYSLNFKKYITYSEIFIEKTENLFHKYLTWFIQRFKIEQFEMNTYLSLFSKKNRQLFKISDQNFNIFNFVPEIIKNKNLKVTFQIMKNHIPKTFIAYQEAGEKIYFLGEGVVLIPVLFHEMGHAYQIAIIKEKHPFWEVYIADRNLAEEFTSQLFEISFLWSKDVTQIGFEQISKADVLKFYFFHRLLEMRKMFGRLLIDHLCMNARTIEELYEKQQIIQSEYEKYLKRSLAFEVPSNFGLEDIALKEYITKENNIFYASGLLYIGDFINRFGFDWQTKPEAMDLLHKIILNGTNIESELSDDPAKLIGLLHRIDEYVQDFESKHS